MTSYDATVRPYRSDFNEERWVLLETEFDDPSGCGTHDVSTWLTPERARTLAVRLLTVADEVDH